MPDVALVELPPINLRAKEVKRCSLEEMIEGHDVRLFVEENDVCTSLEESVSSRETGEAATDDDDTSH